METINFPKKKLRTPEEFQRGYMRRWWATIARTAALSLPIPMKPATDSTANPATRSGEIPPVAAMGYQQ